jgi:hypothetical protein
MSPAYPKKKVLQQAKSSMFVGCWLILKIEWAITMSENTIPAFIIGDFTSLIYF